MYDRILVPLDGSESAKRVLPYVKLLGKAMGSRVALFTVIRRTVRCALAILVTKRRGPASCMRSSRQTRCIVTLPPRLLANMKKQRVLWSVPVNA